MPIRWFDASRDDSVGMAVQQLLTVGGITDVTMRAVARTARMSLGTLGNHYGSKEQMLMGAARAIGTLHVDDLITRAAWDDTLAQVLAGYVPRDAEELLELKVWQDLVTVGRSSRGVGEVVAAVEARHRALLGRTLERYRGAEWTAGHLEAVWTLLQGVRTELIRPGGTLDITSAAGLAAQAADLADGSPTASTAFTS